MADDERNEAAVCSLPPPERTQRLTWIRRALLPRARAAWRLPDGRAWAFANEAALRAELEALVEFERGCCGSLTWKLEAEPETLRLSVRGLDPDAWPFGELDAPAGAGSNPDRGQRAVRAGAGGLAAGGLAVLACELPVVLGVLGLGAAPWLDAFAVAALAGGAALLGWGLWRNR